MSGCDGYAVSSGFLLMLSFAPNFSPFTIRVSIGDKQ